VIGVPTPSNDLICPSLVSKRDRALDGKRIAYALSLFCLLGLPSQEQLFGEWHNEYTREPEAKSRPEKEPSLAARAQEATRCRNRVPLMEHFGALSRYFYRRP
jgi:hypothetical protein